MLRIPDATRKPPRHICRSALAEALPSGQYVRVTTRHATSDDDANDSPFAHVPMANAGPSPMQEGPTTYGRMVAATGRVNLSGSSPRRRLVVRVVIGGVLAILVLSVLVSWAMR
jgi:hypothetical protein